MEPLDDENAIEAPVIMGTDGHQLSRQEICSAFLGIFSKSIKMVALYRLSHPMVIESLTRLIVMLEGVFSSQKGAPLVLNFDLEHWRLNDTEVPIESAEAQHLLSTFKAHNVHGVAFVGEVKSFELGALCEFFATTQKNPPEGFFNEFLQGRGVKSIRCAAAHRAAENRYVEFGEEAGAPQRRQQAPVRKAVPPVPRKPAPAPEREEYPASPEEAAEQEIDEDYIRQARQTVRDNAAARAKEDLPAPRRTARPAPAPAPESEELFAAPEPEPEPEIDPEDLRQAQFEARARAAAVKPAPTPAARQPARAEPVHELDREDYFTGNEAEPEIDEEYVLHAQTKARAAAKRPAPGPEKEEYSAAPEAELEPEIDPEDLRQAQFEARARAAAATAEPEAAPSPGDQVDVDPPVEERECFPEPEAASAPEKEAEEARSASPASREQPNAEKTAAAPASFAAAESFLSSVMDEQFTDLQNGNLKAAPAPARRPAEAGGVTQAKTEEKKKTGEVPAVKYEAKGETPDSAVADMGHAAALYGPGSAAAVGSGTGTGGGTGTGSGTGSGGGAGSGSGAGSGGGTGSGTGSGGGTGSGSGDGAGGGGGAGVPASLRGSSFGPLVAKLVDTISKDPDPVRVSAYKEALTLVRDAMEKQVAETRKTLSEVAEATNKLIAEKESILNTRSRTERVLNTVADGKVIVDKEGRILMMNRAAEEIAGKKFRDVVGHHISENLKPGEHFLTLSGDMDIPKGGKITGQVNVTGDKAVERAMRRSMALLEDDEGRVVGAYSTLPDVAKYKETQRLQEEFLSRITHDLQSPLSSITSALEMLTESAAPRLDSTENTFLDISIRNSRRLVQMIRGILDFSKLQSGKMDVTIKPCSLSAIITEAGEGLVPWARSKEITLVIKPPTEDMKVLADHARMVQVLTNLLSNALKSTPKGGKVTVATSLLPGDPSKVIVGVKDTGHGMSKEDLGKIFEKFVQIKSQEPREGVGLGLNIVHEFIRLHSGKIWARSEQGKGATFYFTLPLALAEVAAGVEA